MAVFRVGWSASLAAIVCAGILTSVARAEFSFISQYGQERIRRVLDCTYFDCEDTFVADPDAEPFERYIGEGLTVTRVDDFGIGGVLNAVTGRPGAADDQLWQVEFVRVTSVFSESDSIITFGYDTGNGDGFVALVNELPRHRVTTAMIEADAPLTWAIRTYTNYSRYEVLDECHSDLSINPFGFDRMITYRVEGLEACGAVWLLLWEDSFSFWEECSECPGDADYDDMAVEIVAAPGVDTDGDGIADCCDLCPDTPGCAAVDVDGCSIAEDSDFDGVIDSCDLCPLTPRCAMINVATDGCSSEPDSDDDGVNDCGDSCPDTPSCAVVDADGCVLDEDRDGIPDGCDECPDTAPCAAAVEENGCATDPDSDSDGVIDCYDLCPDTPSCVSPVTVIGCYYDQDQDGVPDGCDLCPATNPHGDHCWTALGADGCPVDTDSDGDGVIDCEDQFDDTPACAVSVDPVGRARDLDGDGVPDGCDLCPDTPSCAAVDADGCTDTTLDADGDGVVDGCDICAETPAGLDVDTFGCRTDIDADGDGVSDFSDQCPDTPACAVGVYDDGCPIDSDRDGAPDSCDQCPATPSCATADANGCATDGDMDGDGVVDCADACDATPACALGIVGINGCEDRSDHDGDGVIGACDRCPETPDCALTVDSEGCADLGDDDGDGAPNTCELCPGTTLAPFGVDDHGCAIPVPGDFDEDFDVDQSDFGRFQACLSGAGIPQNDPLCARARIDNDDDADIADVAAFQACMTGADILGDPNCAAGQ